MKEIFPKKVDAFLSFEKALASVDAPKPDMETQKVGCVLLHAFEKVAMGCAVLPFEPETQKVDNALLPFEKAAVGAVVLKFVLETQREGYALPLAFEKETSWVVAGMQVLVGMGEE